MTNTTASLSRLSEEIADLAAATAPSVVEVQSHRSLASGFVWRSGLIVTPDETLAEEGPIRIERADGTVLDAVLVGRDPATDVALLRAEGVAGDDRAVAGAVRAGSLALVVGAAESAPLVAFGVVTAVGPAWQSMRGGTIDARLELGVRLQRRTEGGLAMTASGGSIGMAVRGPRGRTLVIPAATIDRVASELVEHGRVRVAYLGAGLQDVPLDDGGRGAMVMTLDRAGPAAAAGVLQGDIVVTWAGEPISHVAGLLRTLRATPIGTTVPVGLRRGGTAAEASITVGDRPQQ